MAPIDTLKPRNKKEKAVVDLAIQIRNKVEELERLDDSNQMHIRDKIQAGEKDQLTGMELEEFHGNEERILELEEDLQRLRHEFLDKLAELRQADPNSPILDDEDIAGVTRVLRSGQVVQGQCVASLEKELASLVGVNHAVAVSSGTAALHLALLALGLAVSVSRRRYT